MKQSIPAEISQQTRAAENTVRESGSGAMGQLVDARPDAVRLRQLGAMIDAGPRMVAQRKQAAAIAGGARMTAQRARAAVAPNRTGLPDGLKDGIEALSGIRMDTVRVHYNSDKPAQLGAHAYAQGNEINVAPGQERHLPHEAWHVVQQAQGRVRATRQMKGGIDINDDAGLEAEADVMGERALAMAGAADVPTAPLALPGGGRGAPVQGRFGFEVELPILFLHNEDFDVPSAAGGAAIPMDNVPCDAALHNGEENVHAFAHGHVNVDHFAPLNSLYVGELGVYSQAFPPDARDNAKQSLVNFTGTLLPHGASIVEVVTNPWDESALDRNQALGNVRAVINFVRGLYANIAGNRQAALGPYFIGSDFVHSNMFQPQIGYFHATYGVKLSKVPELFKKTTEQKSRLRRYANREVGERKHAENVQATFDSIGAAKRAMSSIKNAWPRTGARRFKKGTKNWNRGDEGIFLGFLTLLTNYLSMFRRNNADNLAKQMVGMHYYKSDLYDVARQLPNAVINRLDADAALLAAVIAAIGAECGFAPGDRLGGPMGGMTLTTYLEQIFTGNRGVILSQNGDDFRDDMLAGGINPYSRKLGPEPVGPGGNQEPGVVMENRHLEYTDRRYGDLQDASVERATANRNARNHINNNADQARVDSFMARDENAARRPIDEWEGIMMNIYDMLKLLNR